VFPSAKFKNAARKWVMLKLDVDAAPSFEMKSQFKIGGYPTLVAVQSPTSQNLAELNEIERIVGYYPVNEFVGLLDKAYADRMQTFADKLAVRRELYRQTLRQAVEVALEKKDAKESRRLAEEGVRAAPDDLYFQVALLAVQAKEDPSVLKDKKTHELLKTINSNLKAQSTETLLKMEDLVASHPDPFSKDEVLSCLDMLDQMKSRVNDETLSVPGVELSVADIDAMRVDVAEALKDEALAKKFYLQTADSYQRLIDQFHGQNSRGYHLEMAYALWKGGKVDQAKSIYTKFIQKYPKEFTFYYAASKMYLELKDYPMADKMAENAVLYSYGDNKWRSMERLVRVLIAMGDVDQALKRGSDFLAMTDRPDEGLNVRTNRYVKALEEAVKEAEKLRGKN
jgi:tetratricopeptide (TPR) repeat protein